MYAQRVTIAPVTNGSGDATAYSAEVVSGRIISVVYTIDGTAPYTSGAVDFTITGADSGVAILTVTNVSASFTKAPRQATHDTAGVATLYAASGAAVLDHIVLANERIKIVVAQGGDTKTGSFVITVA